MICVHIVPYVNVQGSGMLSLRQSLIMLRGLGQPWPSIQRLTLWSSHLRLSHIPVVGLHSMFPIMNLLTCTSE